MHVPPARSRATVESQNSSAEPPTSSCGAGLAAIGPTSAGSSRIGVSQIAGSSRSAASGVAHVPSDLPTTSTRQDVGSAPATSARTQATPGTFIRSPSHREPWGTVPACGSVLVTLRYLPQRSGMWAPPSR